MKNVLAIVGSASKASSNLQLIHYLANNSPEHLKLTLYKPLKELPPFDPELSLQNTPGSILELRESIEAADGIIVCSPEYVFSIPSGLKNLIEWCVSTTIFTDKTTGIITAAAQGQKAHEELQLLLQTLMAQLSEETTLLIPGISGKFNADGQLIDETVKNQLQDFIIAFDKKIH
jgi:NAD(P)H-dependent FMN reductase